MFSFGHCPNYLPPLPIFRATCTSFSAVKYKCLYCIFQFGQGPHSGNARKKTFFLKEVFPYPGTFSQGISGKYLVCQGWDVGRRGLWGWGYQVVRWSGTCQGAVLCTSTSSNSSTSSAGTRTTSTCSRRPFLQIVK